LQGIGQTMNEIKVYDRACEACLQNCYQVLSTAIALKDRGGEVRFMNCREICLDTRETVRALTTPPTSGDNAPVLNVDDLSGDEP
jgi:hypothetical protein